MELVVLNVGLDLGVISPRLFTIMVMMAIVTTAMTAPLLDCCAPDGMISRRAPRRMAKNANVMPTPAAMPMPIALPLEPVGLSSVMRAMLAMGTSTGASGTRVFFCTTIAVAVVLISVPRNEWPEVCSTRTLLPAGSFST
jgi:hypothetical protein